MKNKSNSNSGVRSFTISAKTWLYILVLISRELERPKSLWFREIFLPILNELEFVSHFPHPSDVVTLTLR